MSTRFFVAGIPVPQGSLRSFAHAKTGKVVTPQSNKVLAFRDLVAHEASKHFITPLTGPVVVELVFWMPRPKSHFGTGRNEHVRKPSAPLHHCKPPDVDKLARAVLDALTYVAFNDDSQVVELVAAKTWAGATAKPGVHVRVGEAAEWFDGGDH